MAPDGKETTIPPSMGGKPEPENPTVLPLEVLKEFNWAFLIRHPRRAIPSYWRCTIPPLDEVTGFSNFMPNEAGYAELVRLFDYLIEQGLVDRSRITVLDADDMLDNPEGTIRVFCERVGIDFQPEMLVWNDDDQKHAATHFAKWHGFHEDAIDSTRLRARSHAQVRGTAQVWNWLWLLTEQKTSTIESEDEEWRQKYGDEAQKIIRDCVNTNIPHYEYLKRFALTA